MAVTTKWYGKAFTAAFNKEIDFDTDTIKVALATSSYTPDQDAHDYFNDVTNEVSGTGYTAGGATLASKAVAYSAGSNLWSFDAADVTWSNSTLTARYAIVYLSTGTSSTSPLIAYIDFGADVSSSGSTFTIQFDASGIVTVTVS